jgi:hypothetical protein
MTSGIYPIVQWALRKGEMPYTIDAPEQPIAK